MGHVGRAVVVHAGEPVGIVVAQGIAGEVIGLASEPVGGVVAIGGDVTAAHPSLAGFVAVRIIGIRRLPAVAIRNAGQLIGVVVGIARHVRVRIGDRCEPIGIVIGVGRGVAEGIGN